jgi:hypothetical protein
MGSGPIAGNLACKPIGKQDCLGLKRRRCCKWATRWPPAGARHKDEIKY